MRKVSHRATDGPKNDDKHMTGKKIPRLTEQPINTRSSNKRPTAGATLLRVSLFPAFGSYGCSIDGVNIKPTVPSERSHLKMTIVPEKTIQVEPMRRSALVTTDALLKKKLLGSDALLFSVDRLFHRRSC